MTGSEEAREVIQYLVLLVGGFGFLYQLLVLWGFSTGLASPGPWFALLGGLLVFPAAAATSPGFPRIAAWIGLLGGALGLVWPFTGFALGMGAVPEMLLYAALPAFIAVFSGARILVLRASPVPGRLLSTGPRAVLTVAPIVLFLLFFNSGAVLGALLGGPSPHR